MGTWKDQAALASEWGISEGNAITKMDGLCEYTTVETITSEHGKSGSSYSYTIRSVYSIGRRKSDGAVVVKCELQGKKPGNWSDQDAEAKWTARRSTESSAVSYYKYLSGYIGKTYFQRLWVAYYIDSVKSKQTYPIVFDSSETTSLSVDAYGDIFYIKVDGSWKQATPWVNVNGTWKQAVGRIKINGSWV